MPFLLKLLLSVMELSLFPLDLLLNIITITVIFGQSYTSKLNKETKSDLFLIMIY